jgi:hypothetical protein
VRGHSLDRLRELIRARTLEQPSLKHPALGYVRYQRPPVVEPVETLVLESGERLQGEIKYYDYGVLSLVFELGFMDGWSKLIELASRWGVGCRLRGAGDGDCPRQTGTRRPCADQAIQGMAERRLPDLSYLGNY